MSVAPPSEITAGLSSIREKLGVGPPKLDPWFSHLIYADSGVGKTHYLGTALDHPDLHPILILDCAGGDETLIPHQNNPNISVKQIRSIASLVKCHVDLYKYNQGWYKTVAVDNISEVNDTDMAEVMRAAELSSKNPENFNIDVPSPREWGIGRNHLRKIIRAYKDLPVNLILTAYEYTEAKEGKAERIMPSLVPAKLRTEIPGFMSLVGWYRFADPGMKKRVMQVQGTNRVLAKNRYQFPGAINDPTYPMIWEMVQDYRKIHGHESLNKEIINESGSA